MELLVIKMEMNYLCVYIRVQRVPSTIELLVLPEVL